MKEESGGKNNRRNKKGRQDVSKKKGEPWVENHLGELKKFKECD